MLDYQSEESKLPLNELESMSTSLIRHKNSHRIRVRLWRKERIVSYLLFTGLILISLYTFLSMDYGNIKIIEAVKQFFSTMSMIFFQPQLSGRSSLFSLVEALGTTIGLAILTTILGSITALFLGLFSAQNLGHPTVSTSIRTFMSFVRAVPTILWVMIFSILIGLGANAAIIGMSFHSIAYLTKVYAESIEEIDFGTIEALTACGASWWQIVFQGVLPTCITALLSWTFIRFEINFTNAIAVGAAAGAGGLGFQLIMASNFYFDFREIGVLVYMILAVVVLLELTSIGLKRKYLAKT
ncbi:putative phosphonate ABC transporter, permease protein PhnE [Enterococcus faecalis 13-SD-W-01]|nr:putative phosphonate ABC transporter, permease protein PhnE [Enterococcus faecalis 13-SD-W-01]